MNLSAILLQINTKDILCQVNFRRIFIIFYKNFQFTFYLLNTNYPAKQAKIPEMPGNFRVKRPLEAADEPYKTAGW